LVRDVTRRLRRLKKANMLEPELENGNSGEPDAEFIDMRHGPRRGAHGVHVGKASSGESSSSSSPCVRAGPPAFRA
jgi:hypothetical protein